MPVTKRFAISYRDSLAKDSFLRGANIEADGMSEAIVKFELKFPHGHIIGILETDSI
jgi:hypothetical protein